MKNPLTTILSLETSCDETAAAISRQMGYQIEILSSQVASQVDVHALTGGVIPEVAAREHVTVIKPLIEKALNESGVAPGALDAIAVTVGPGLVPALAIGVTAAQTLAYAWDKPVIPVNHLEGHIYSALLPPAASAEISNFKFQISNDPSLFPALALIVSGGHSLLVLMPDHLQYQILGQTRDDAAGEAFDKIARLIGLPYPGGPALSRLAESGHPNAYHFTRPMLNSGDLDFSFSGLKTEVFYTLRDNFPPNRGGKGGYKLSRRDQADLAASFQAALVESLGHKVSAAIKQVSPARLLLAGGVAANNALRQHLISLALAAAVPLQIAPLELCGDNAVMISLVAHFAKTLGRAPTWRDLDAHARLNLEKFSLTTGKFPVD